MKNLADLHVYGTEEMIEHAWEEAKASMDVIDSGNARLDAATVSLAEHCFKAGWKRCLVAIIDAENRKDGLT